VFTADNKRSFSVGTTAIALYSLYITWEREKERQHHFRMQEKDPCRKLTFIKLEGTRPAGKPNLRWLKSIEVDIKNMGARNCRRQ
jgi:hypothetical protein